MENPTIDYNSLKQELNACVAREEELKAQIEEYRIMPFFSRVYEVIPLPARGTIPQERNVHVWEVVDRRTINGIIQSDVYTNQQEKNLCEKYLELYSVYDRVREECLKLRKEVREAKPPMHPAIGVILLPVTIALGIGGVILGFFIAEALAVITGAILGVLLIVAIGYFLLGGS